MNKRDLKIQFEGQGIHRLICATDKGVLTGFGSGLAWSIDGHFYRLAVCGYLGWSCGHGDGQCEALAYNKKR